MKTYRVTLTHEVEAEHGVDALIRVKYDNPAPDSVQVEKVESNEWKQ